ncbi:MAG TPA: hypothetical protein VKU83_06285 [Puia sp.]|nr:hypothetical protein [Puia sp.]
MNANTTPKRFLSVRLTSEELEEVYQHSKNSSCRTLTEYVRKVLTKKPVVIKVRNESQDGLLSAMAGIKDRLDQLADRAQGRNEAEMLREIAEIRTLAKETYERYCGSPV